VIFIKFSVFKRYINMKTYRPSIVYKIILISGAKITLFIDHQCEKSDNTTMGTTIQTILKQTQGFRQFSKLGDKN
jgi:hypothetical protein